MRIGHGFDVHAFGGEGPIIIGGVRIPYEKGLLAHSDGDVALHALTDALLGAAALGDIGKLFPDTDPAFKGADSRELLVDCLTRALNEGATITDEASALEYCGFHPELVAGRADNIKVTRPEDLALAEFYLTRSRHQEKA